MNQEERRILNASKTGSIAFEKSVQTEDLCKSLKVRHGQNIAGLSVRGDTIVCLAQKEGTEARDPTGQ